MLSSTQSQSILESLSSAVLVIDSHLRVVFANNSAQQLLGKSERGLYEHSITDWLGRGLVGDLANTLSSGQGFTRRETPLTVEQRELAVDLSASRLSDSFGDHLLIELHWVDHLSKLRQETHLLAGEVGSRELARGLAHEIKNPLGGIRGAAQLLSRQLDDPGDQEYLTVIIDEVDRLTRLVDRLKGLQEKSECNDLNIHNLLERTRTLLESEYADIQVERDYDPSLPSIWGDSEQLMQAILNVAKNAAQALVENEVERPRLIFRTRISRQLVLGGTPHRLAIRVSIIDNGPGINDGLRDTLFLPMVSGRAQGSGLGLAIAQQVLTRHQGLVEFESQPGNTCFSLTIPIETRGDSNP